MSDKIYQLDLQKVRPASSIDDYIEPGRYQFKIVDAQDGHPKDSPDKTMFTLVYNVTSVGTEFGKQLTERFTMPRKGSRDSDVGASRLVSLILACRGKVNEEKPTPFSPAAMVGRKFIASVKSKTQEASGDYPERTVSTIGAYLYSSAAGTVEGASAEEVPEKTESREHVNGKVSGMPTDAAEEPFDGNDTEETPVPIQSRRKPATVVVEDNDDDIDTDPNTLFDN